MNHKAFEYTYLLKTVFSATSSIARNYQAVTCACVTVIVFIILCPVFVYYSPLRPLSRLPACFVIFSITSIKETGRDIYALQTWFLIWAAHLGRWSKVKWYYAVKSSSCFFLSRKQIHELIKNRFMLNLTHELVYCEYNMIFVIQINEPNEVI